MRGTLALSLLLLTACSDGVAPHTALTESPVPVTTTASPVPSPTELTVDYAGRLRGDVDGDGNDDVVTIVENGPRDGADWQFGVRAALSSLGTRTAWEAAGGNDAQELTGLHDVNGDGRAEISVLLGTTASAGIYGLATLAGDELVLVVDDALWAGRAEGLRGWGCAHGRLYSTDARRDHGTIAYYELTGGRLVHERTETVRWRAGSAPPEPFGDGIGCGDIGTHAQAS